MCVHCESASVAVYWILFALCSVRVCVCVCLQRCSARPQFSCLVWRADGRVGALLKERSAVVSLSSSSLLLSSLTFSPPFFPFPSFLPPLSPPGFIYQLHPRLPPFLSSLHLLRAILVAEENFFRSLFSSLPLRSVFMCLSGLRAPAIHGGFGMKCLLTEPCAPELR